MYFSLIYLWLTTYCLSQLKLFNNTAIFCDSACHVNSTAAFNNSLLNALA